MSNLDSAVQMLKDKAEALKDLQRYTCCEHEYSCKCYEREHKAEQTFESLSKKLEQFTPELLEQAKAVIKAEEDAVTRKHHLAHVAYTQAERPVSVDIHTLFPDLDCSEATGYCRSFTSNRDGKHYTNWEEEIANPAIDAAGYERLWCWVSGEQDGFGPLERHILVIKDEKFFELSYG